MRSTWPPCLKKFDEIIELRVEGLKEIIRRDKSPAERRITDRRYGAVRRRDVGTGSVRVYSRHMKSDNTMKSRKLMTRTVSAEQAAKAAESLGHAAEAAGEIWRPTVAQAVRYVAKHAGAIEVRQNGDGSFSVTYPEES